MKNKDLHDLKKNEIERLVESAKPFLEEHFQKLVAGAVLCLLLVIGVVYFKYKEPANAQEWIKFYTAANSDPGTATQTFANIAEESRNTIVGQWAQLREADGTLKTGLKLLFTDREQSKENLKRAGDAYSSLIASGSTPNDIKERALFGLASIAEATCDGNTEKPIKQYKALMEQYPDSMYFNLAKDRVENLEKDESKEFYAWFSQLNPKQKDVKGILDATGDPFGDGDKKFELNPKPPKTGESKKSDEAPVANPFPDISSDKKMDDKTKEKLGDNPFKEKKTTPGKTTPEKYTAKPKKIKTPPAPETPKKKDK